eukprot:scaffold128897_cov39-Prasinocladus_malaysianus.AAC.1
MCLTHGTQWYFKQAWAPERHASYRTALHKVNMQECNQIGSLSMPNSFGVHCAGLTRLHYSAAIHATIQPSSTLTLRLYLAAPIIHPWDAFAVELMTNKPYKFH